MWGVSGQEGEKYNKSMVSLKASSGDSGTWKVRQGHQSCEGPGNMLLLGTDVVRQFSVRVLHFNSEVHNE